MKILSFLLSPSPPDPLARILLSWRLWLVGALLGALLGIAVFAVASPPYRARATVVVDNNLEEAYQYFPDRRLFQFLERETRKLEEVAWSDATLAAVSKEVGGVGVSELRTDVLLLSQPAEGGWHFFADDPDSARAERLANAWVEAFARNVRDGVEVSADLERARADLNALLASNPDPDPASIAPLLDEIAALDEAAKGISPYVEVSIAQGADLPVEPRVSQSTYLAFGSIVGAGGLALLALFVVKEEPRGDVAA